VVIFDSIAPDSSSASVAVTCDPAAGSVVSNGAIAIAGDFTSFEPVSIAAPPSVKAGKGDDSGDRNCPNSAVIAWMRLNCSSTAS
jgi:hypothetical protein